MDKLHEKYSSSASILAILERYKIVSIELEEMLEVPEGTANDWIKCKQLIGVDNYKKIIAIYPMFTDRIDYDNTYRGN